MSIAGTLSAVHVATARDAIGRLLHVAFVVVVLATLHNLADVGAQFTAPPNAGLIRVSPAGMQQAVLFVVPSTVLGLLATWVSGFLPLLTTSVRKNTNG